MAGYILKISLEDAHPPVWRRVLVPEKITFADLDGVIQVLFDWDGGHAHAFSLPSLKISIGPNQADGEVLFDWEGEETLLEEALELQKSFRYTYDFGDKGRLKIQLEKQDEAYEGRAPILLKAKGGPLDAEQTQRRLSFLDFPENQELSEAWGKRNAQKRLNEEKLVEIAQQAFEKAISQLGKESIQKIFFSQASSTDQKITKWLKENPEQNGGQQEKIAGSMTNQQLLRLKSREDLENYCKYLQIPARKSWNKEQMAAKISQIFRKHPEYLLYVLSEDEFQEWQAFQNLPLGEIQGQLLSKTTRGKAMDLGLLDADFSNPAYVRLSLAVDAESFRPAMDERALRKYYRRLNRLSDQLGDVMMLYGVIEVPSLYRIFCKLFGESMEEEEFLRFLYWHARMNDKLITGHTDAGVQYAGVYELDLDAALIGMEKYAGDLDYKEFTPREFQRIVQDRGGYYPSIGGLYRTLCQELYLTGTKSMQLLNDALFKIMGGADLPAVLRTIQGSAADVPLSIRCSLWESVSSLMLEFPLPMLKGRSRQEYAREKRLSPWSVQMAGKAAPTGGESGREKAMDAFPWQVQEWMWEAQRQNSPVLHQLEAYQNGHRIQSEEFQYLLAKAKRGKTEEPGTYVRSQPKVGRNDPCPCGSGKKYKHCCGRIK